jgi:hypothetical protein
LSSLGHRAGDAPTHNLQRCGGLHQKSEMLHITHQKKNTTEGAQHRAVNKLRTVVRCEQALAVTAATAEGDAAGGRVGAWVSHCPLVPHDDMTTTPLMT